MIRGRRPALLLAGAVLFVLAFYVAVYPLHGYRLGIGSDTPVYAWWSRYAGAVGLGGLGTGPRAGVVGPLAVLSTVLHVPQADLSAVLGPVLAVATALAAGSLLDAGLGRDRGRVALTVVLTGSFLVLLAPGYFSTLAFGSALVAGLATLTIGLDGRSWWPIGAAAALFAVAGMSHVLFLGPATAILGGGLAALIPASRRAMADGATWSEAPLGRAAVASLGGAVLVVGGLTIEGSLLQVATSGSSAPATARDTILRRAGLSSLVRASYRRKLLHDFSWYRALVTVGAAVMPFLWPGPRRAVRSPEEDRTPAGRSFFLGTIGAWVILTLAGVVALLAGLPSPGQRLAAFCLPLPMLAAVGLKSAFGPDRFGTRTASRALLAVAMAAYAATAWLAWNKERPLEPPVALDQARQAGAALAAEPDGTPLILVIDDYSDRPALYIVRALNYVRAAVPGDRVGDVYGFVGTPEDFLAAHPTLTGRAEHDALAASFWEEAAKVRGHDALAVSIQALDPHRYARAAAIPGARRIAPGVVALPGFGGPTCAPPCGRPRFADTGAGPFSPWKPVWLAPVLLAVLALLGLPWSAAVLRSRRGLAATLAPAFGLAALSLAALLADAVGLRLDAAGGWVALALALGGGAATAVARGALRPAPLGPGRAVEPEPPSPGPERP